MAAAGPDVVLVVGSREDPHVEAVVSRLRDGARAIVLDPWAEAASRVAYRYGEGSLDVVVEDREDRVALSEVTAVWWRLKPSVAAFNERLTDPVTAAFVQREWAHVLDPLDDLLACARWVNPRQVDRRVRHKPVQLDAALRAGFSIPPTLISNDSEAVTEFVRSTGDDAIYKSLDYFFRPPDRLLFTSLVTAEQTAASREQIRMAPGIFQRRLDKAYELRVTVVGDEAFPVRIDSQAHDSGKLDWRRAQSELDWVPCELPAEVHGRLRRVHRSLGLVYGAYDFIVTPEGDHVFLEVNPAGQWLWLERAIDLQISAALARELVRAG
jgi:hypothetical protein